MHSKVACDHYDHDHYADDVKDIHYPAPICVTFAVASCHLLLNNRRDSDLVLSKSAHANTIRRAG